MVALKCNLILIRIQLSFAQRPLFNIDSRVQHSPQALGGCMSTLISSELLEVQ